MLKKSLSRLVRQPKPKQGAANLPNSRNGAVRNRAGGIPGNARRPRCERALGGSKPSKTPPGRHAMEVQNSPSKPACSMASAAFRMLAFPVGWASKIMSRKRVPLSLSRAVEIASLFQRRRLQLSALQARPAALFLAVIPRKKSGLSVSVHLAGGCGRFGST